jgi:hypothetical protein
MSLKNSKDTIEPATFRLVEQFLRQLCHCVPHYALLLTDFTVIPVLGSQPVDMLLISEYLSGSSVAQ